MPKWMDDLVKKLLADPDFYPDDSPEERKSKAWAIAQKQYKQKKKKSGSEAWFDGELQLMIESGSKSIADAKDVMDGSFYGVKPNDQESLMVLVTAQTDAVKRDAYMVMPECYEEGLPRLTKKRWNTLFSTHRYYDEYAIGTTRKFISPNQFVVEIHRGENRQQGNITAQGIIDKRIKAVSTGFEAKVVICGICGAEGKPYLPCDHWAGQEVKGKRNIVKIKRADYFELSTTAIGLDPGALVIHHNSIGRLYHKETGDTFINEEEEKVEQPNIKGIPTKMSVEDKEELKEFGKLKAENANYKTKLEDINTRLETLENDLKAKDTQIAALRENNSALSKQLEEQAEKEKDELIKKAYETQVAAGWVIESMKTQTVKFLESQSSEQLEIIIAQAEAFIKMNNIKKSQTKSTKPNVPINPDTQGSVEGHIINDPNKRNKKLYETLAKFQKIMKPKAERAIQGGGNLFQEVFEDEREMPSGHVDSGEVEG